MKITPKGAPSHLAPPTTQVSARQRAVEFLEKTMTPAADPVPSLGSKTAPPQDHHSIATIEESRQSGTNEGSVSAEQVSETAAPEATKTPAAPEEPISSQYAILARKEKALRDRVKAQEASYKAREEALKAREDALNKTNSVDTSKYIDKARLLEDPITALAELGLSYDNITEKAVNAPSPEEIARRQYERKVDEEIKALKAQLEESKQSQVKQQQASYDQAVKQIHNEVKTLVETDANFETIKSTESIKDVVDLIEKTFKEDGVLLSVEEAAKEVEDYLVEQAIKLAKLSKIQQRLKPAETSQPAPKQTATPPQQQIKTLTNSLASSRKLSARDRALMAYRGEKIE